MNYAERSNRFEVAMLSLREEYGDDMDVALIQLLVDAMHWHKPGRADFEELLHTAQRYFATELTEGTGRASTKGNTMHDMVFEKTTTQGGTI